LHDASGERAAVGAGTGSLGTLLKKNAPHCSWRGLWRDRGGDALTPLSSQQSSPSSATQTRPNPKRKQTIVLRRIKKNNNLKRRQLRSNIYSSRCLARTQETLPEKIWNRAGSRKMMIRNRSWRQAKRRAPSLARSSHDHPHFSLHDTRPSIRRLPSIPVSPIRAYT
jgi:hypothetical protein